ncbi:MAG: CRTAC1 family protein, partial [Gemmatimonadales bacterium]
DYDLFVSHFRGETNTLYRAVEHGYRDETNAAGLGAVGRPQTGFGTGFFDFDNDGDLDVVVVNGGVARGPMSTIDPNDYWRAYSEPNFLFENTEETGARAGAHFTDISALAPQLTAQIANSRGLAFGDFDNDGRVDLLVTNGGGRARLLRNTAAAGHWLLVKMLDPALRRDAYGATIAATVGSRTMRRLVAPGYSYQSSNDPRVHFGLGESTVVDELAVTWPDGTVERYTNVAADQIVVLTKGIGMASNE